MYTIKIWTNVIAIRTPAVIADFVNGGRMYVAFLSFY
jgi:hypothetical protein